LFGAFGALLATPIVAAAWVVIASLYNSIRGESADTMLATNRRSSWIRKREGDSPKRRSLIDGLRLKSPPPGSVPERENPPHDQARVNQPERIDLMRPIPYQVASDEDQPTPAASPEAETAVESGDTSRQD